MPDSLDAKYLLRSSAAEKKRWEDAAYRRRLSLAVWMREVLNREAAGAGNAGVTVVRDAPETVQPQVREPVDSPGGPPPQVRLPSSPVGSARVRARGMADRGGRCSADVAYGSRCKLCGEVHR